MERDFTVKHQVNIIQTADGSFKIDYEGDTIPKGVAEIMINTVAKQLKADGLDNNLDEIKNRLNEINVPIKAVLLWKRIAYIMLIIWGITMYFLLKGR